MTDDSRTAPDLDSPYGVLEPAGFTPQASMKLLHKARAYFMRRGEYARVSGAFDRVDTPKKRLLVDFFLYRIETTHGAADAPSEIGASDRGPQEGRA